MNGEENGFQEQRPRHDSETAQSPPTAGVPQGPDERAPADDSLSMGGTTAAGTPQVHAARGRPDLWLVKGEQGIESFQIRPPDDLEVRYCYRHPDRETGVSCSSCGRPICWECMTPAPVGFHCPECVGQARAERRRAPVVTRGQLRDRWAGVSPRNASVTKVLVALNVIMFVVELVVASGGTLMGMSGAGLVDLGSLVPGLVVVDGDYWRLFSSMFLHASLWHLLFNMWALYVAGTLLEAELGSLRFALLYFVSGFAGSVAVMLFADPFVNTVGASGAVYGLFGALFLYALHGGGRVPSMVARQLGFLIVINLAFTFLSSGISWQAHVGGLIGGAAAIEALCWFGRRRLAPRPSLADMAFLALVAAVFLVVLIVRAMGYPTLV